MPVFAWFLLLVLSVVWGGSFFFNAVLLAELSSFGVVFGRVFIGFLILYAVIRFRRQRLDLAANWKLFLGMGVLNNFLPFNLIVFGQTFVDSGLASIFNATTPFFTIVLAYFLARDEDIRAHKLVGVLLGAAGVAVLFEIGSGGLNPVSLIGGTMVMMASVSYAFAGIFGRRFGRLAPEVSACGMLLFSSILCLPIAAYSDWDHYPALSLGGWGALLGIAALSTSFAYILYFRILQIAGAVNVVLVTLVIPVNATLLGVLFLGETVTGTEILGMAIIGIGLLVVDGRILRVLRVGKA